MGRIVLVTVLAVLGSLVVAVPQAEAGPRQTCSSGVSADFNGDGYMDLAVGAPSGDTDTVNGAGVVNVIYGGPSGIATGDTPAPQLWFQGPRHTNGAGDLAGTPQVGDRFGGCLAAGDFNGDGDADLAIGVSGDRVRGRRAGTVAVLYGSPTGLTNVSNQLWSQNSPGIPDTARNGNTFGAAVATGDFNGDGYTDLAIGAPYESLPNAGEAGTVTVVYGSVAGLTASGSQRWQQGRSRFGHLQGHPEAGDRFGATLATGDFGGVGRDALAIGVPGEGVFGHDRSEGVVQVVYSNSSGLVSSGNQLWFPGHAHLRGIAEPGDTFGAALASADFNGDGADDLAVGIPLGDVNGITNAGAVNVIYGNPTSHTLTSSNDQLWTQDSPGILDQAETNDHFGASLTAGDFDGDGKGDLAIGVPLEDVNAADVGAINVIYGSTFGLDATAERANQIWHEGAGSAGGVAEAGDDFGAALASGDYNDDGFFDLVMGVPGKDVHGAVFTMLGSSTGITAVGDGSLDQTSTGVPGDPHAGDQWGAALG